MNSHVLDDAIGSSQSFLVKKVGDLNEVLFGFVELLYISLDQKGIAKEALKVAIRLLIHWKKGGRGIGSKIK